MNEAELDRVERELGVTLPASYRELMTGFPIRACSGNEEFALWDSADGLIRLNRQYRDEFAWQNHLFALGQLEGDTATYAIDLRDPVAPVWWIDHWQPHATGSGLVQPAFAAWAESYVAELRSDLERDGIDPDAGQEERRRLEAASARRSLVALSAFLLFAILGAAVIVAALARTD